MHSKDKVRCADYLAQLKGETEITPFLVKFENNAGYYGDYEFIAMKKELDINTIEKKLKANKYPTPKEFYRQLKAFFENFIMFCFDGDEVNTAARKLMRMVTEQQRSHTQISSNQANLQNQPAQHQPATVSKAQPKPQLVAAEPPQTTKRATLAQKIEMIYLLRTYESNFQEIKEIGDTYKIGKLTETEYTIRLEGLNWLERLKK